MTSESAQLAAETEEQDRLAVVTGRLRHALQNLDSRLSSYARNVREQKSYFWESKADMDGAEKAFTRQSIEQTIVTAKRR